MGANKNDLIMRNAVFLWIVVATGTLLLIPLVAMQFTDEVNWELNDFVVMGFLIFTASSFFILATRNVEQKNRLIVGVACLFIFLWLWAELAVGVFTNWGS